ncbi:Ankyrin repeat-containing domain protein [Elaphomyces granulatus]
MARLCGGDGRGCYKRLLENWGTGITHPPTPLSLGVKTGELEKDPAWRTKEMEILRRLDKSPYRDRKKNEIQIGYQGHSSRMLWVSADPGCGKSVLAKYLVNSVLASTESRTTCYFFFKDDFEDQRSIVCALCCILRQLLLQKRVLLSEKIFEQFQMDGERFMSSFNELWDAITSAAEDKNAGEIICVFDAIDEGEDRGRTQLIQALCKLYGTRTDFNLKFLVTSRPYGEIRRGFQPLKVPGLPVIHLSGESDVEMEKISRDIDVFINARAKNIGAQLNLRTDGQELLLQGLMRVPNRTYLWVYLTLDLIESDIDIDETGIVKATSHLPKTVDEAYERILSRSRNFKEAKRLLHIIVAAERPLTLKEMSIRRAFSREHIRENIRDLCGLFVTIIDLRMYLLHQTAKEFLVQNSLAKDSKSLQSNFKWKYSLRPQESHRILAETCIWHLLFGEFETHPLNANTRTSHHVDRHIFLDYSAKHWTVHFNKSYIEADAVIQSLPRICDASSNSCMTWFSIYWTSMNTDFPKNFTTLMIASYFGLEAVVKQLEVGGIDINSDDGTYGHSLGLQETDSILLGAEVEPADKYGRTALSYAAWNGHIATIKLLLKAGARVDSTDEIGGSPLSYAICYGHNDVVGLLLKNGAQVDSPDNISKVLLLSAAEKGYEAVVGLLLENGIDLESKDRFGQTPLLWASRNRHEAVVKLLPEKGADLESKGSGWTPPLVADSVRHRYRASEYGHEAVVKLLLEKGAYLESKDRSGWTPLLSAAKNGHEVVGGFDQTPLLVAAGNGHEAMVKLLLEKGADLESKDCSGRTPRSWAAEKGHEAIVKLLEKASKNFNK